MRIAIKLILLNVFLIGNIWGLNNNNNGPGPSYLFLANYSNCEGPEAGNYTLVGGGILAADCINAYQRAELVLIKENLNNTKSVISIQPLIVTAFPAGGFLQIEAIWLAISGPLQGKYVYQKQIALVSAYSKKCSSVLGYSYISTNKAVLLISPNLDMDVFLSPKGAFPSFKRGSTTICSGNIVFL